MKRELFDNVRVIPDASGAVIDREGFLSAVIGISIGTVTGEPTGSAITVKVEHCDTGSGVFEAAPDSRLDPEHVTEGGILKAAAAAEGDSLSLNLDLIGCKRYIKITPSLTFEGGTSPAADVACATVLGDPAVSPA